MKIKRWILMLVAMCLLLPGAAAAESTLYACREDGALRVEWSAEGECELTIYRDGWPVSVCTVDGAAGGTTVSAARSGKYSVRLKTAEGCLKVNAEECGAEAPQPTETPKATATPEATEAPKQTCASEVTCTPEATVTPAATNPTRPTNVPETTAAPEETKEPEPTVTLVPTATPIVRPTATPVPTAAPTVVPTATPGSSGSSMSSMAAEVVAQVNAERAKYGLGSLTVSDELTNAACVRASEIIQQFSHTRPDGSSCFTVSSAAFGENIAKGQSNADRVMAAWMSSEGHRANILRESYGSIGVCALKVNGVIYWVQLFGK